MKQQLITQWSITIALALLLAVLTFYLKHSALYLLTQEPALNAVFNGMETKEVIYPATFNQHLALQLNRVKPVLAASGWDTCTGAFLNREKSGQAIRQLVDQANCKDLLFDKNGNQVKLSLQFVSTPSLQLNYYFTKNKTEYSFDSLVGLDELLVHFTHAQPLTIKSF